MKETAKHKIHQVSMIIMATLLLSRHLWAMPGGLSGPGLLAVFAFLLGSIISWASFFAYSIKTALVNGPRRYWWRAISLIITVTFTFLLLGSHYDAKLLKSISVVIQASVVITGAFMILLKTMRLFVSNDPLPKTWQLHLISIFIILVISGLAWLAFL